MIGLEHHQNFQSSEVGLVEERVDSGGLLQFHCRQCITEQEKEEGDRSGLVLVQAI